MLQWFGCREWIRLGLQNEYTEESDTLNSIGLNYT